MTNKQVTDKRQGYCPVYDIECPSGLSAAESCEMRFNSDYNPLTSYRDSDIEHCAIYRKQQQESSQEKSESKNLEK